MLDKNNIPKHIAVIMDGNGRWAKGRGAKRIFGHQNAIEAVRQTTEESARIGVKYLTLYAFSTENWSRPKTEVTALMTLLVHTIRKETKTLMENDIRLNAIGDISELPSQCQKELEEARELTKDNSTMVLTLALNYGARSEILRATKSLAGKVKSGEIDIEDIDNKSFENELYTYDMPDPELMIRTSGEMRISNFLLWQLAYAELYVTDTFWPDFRKEHLHIAIESYQNRERRFGKTSEQLTT